MIVYLTLLLIIVVWKIKNRIPEYNEGFLEKCQTDAIKGIFIIVVFINHIGGYYTQCGTDLSAWYDKIFFLPAKALGQLMVVMFLFYSGYGVMEGIKNKGQTYIVSVPRKRVLGTLINFDIAVIIFAVTAFLLGIPLTLQHFYISLIGWDSVGNSNWYIFVIMICYALTFIGQKIKPSMGGGNNLRVDSYICLYSVNVKGYMVV